MTPPGGRAVKFRMMAGLAVASLMALAFTPAAHANPFNQATEINFSAPVRVPGQVLPAGTYWFVLLDRGNYPRVVQIFNGDRTRLITTLQTAYADRLEPSSSTVLVFARPDTAQNPHGNVAALTEWFYPGRDVGNQFLYSNWREKRLNEETHVTVRARHAVAVGY